MSLLRRGRGELGNPYAPLPSRTPGKQAARPLIQIKEVPFGSRIDAIWNVCPPSESAPHRSFGNKRGYAVNLAAIAAPREAASQLQLAERYEALAALREDECALTDR